MASPSDGDIRSQTPMAQDLSSSTVNAAESQYTPADYKRVLRKVDMILLPLMWVCYGTQQADKTSISTQATFGMREDTGLVGQQFSWLTTIFYIMYLIGEAPGNYIMQRTSLRYTLAACMFVWGIIVLSIGFTHNFTQLMVLRALQGFAECTISPAFLLITATFYVSREHTMRSIVWGTSNAGMGIITQLIMYGIGKGAAHNPNGMQPWRYISIFLGCLTILLSVFSYFILGTPNEVKWLNAEEKRIVAARVVSNQTGSERQKHSEWKWDQVISAFKDPQTYFFFFTVIVNSLPNGGTTSFGNLVYVSFGFTPLETLVKGRIPQDVVSICWFLFVGIMTLKKPNLRFIFMVISTIPAFIGMLALALLPKDGMLWTRWGLYLMTVTGNLPGLLIWTFLPSNVAGRTKKSVTGTVIFVAYCVGNSIGAQTFRAEWAPKYIPSIIICATMYALECCLFICWRFYYIWQNKIRDKKVAEMGLTAEESAHQGQINGESDMTDRENIHFRYSM
ncbi:major facilitator superfamily domain-containing protein [Ilyonectria robusta]|uniref:major facilitator superfamily domain-containing protein n=1 Tax=Ilyonectria robusta TaxID=1079257 RepID=UPI001E8E0DA8|nr:major facilitator superfamily domain-containing protein [Ilyonectria robusta]KAH8736459.1 major facilitator superfamily domain-containing protein [Ilyonectria robusta]